MNDVKFQKIPEPNWEAVANRLYGIMLPDAGHDYMKRICPEIYLKMNSVMFIEKDSGVEIK